VGASRLRVKTSLDTTGSANLRLVAQCLNQLQYHMPDHKIKKNLLNFLQVCYVAMPNVGYIRAEI